MVKADGSSISNNTPLHTTAQSGAVRLIMQAKMPNTSPTTHIKAHWVGDATVKDRTLKEDHPWCTHGLVVVLEQVDVDQQWHELAISIQTWLDNNTKGQFLNVQTGQVVLG